MPALGVVVVVIIATHVEPYCEEGAFLTRV